MSDLIPESAWDAAYDSADDNFYTDGIVNSAAPHIAAHALRQAAADFSDPNLSDWETALVRTYLLTRANKLKANAAFTELVQLGQEIEGNNE